MLSIRTSYFFTFKIWILGYRDPEKVILQLSDVSTLIGGGRPRASICAIFLAKTSIQVEPSALYELA
jgi:hypothetical protein